MDPNCIDTLMFFVKVDFVKDQQASKNYEQFPGMQTVNNVSSKYFHLNCSNHYHSQILSKFVIQVSYRE